MISAAIIFRKPPSIALFRSQRESLRRAAVAVGSVGVGPEVDAKADRSGPASGRRASGAHPLRSVIFALSPSGILDLSLDRLGST